MKILITLITIIIVTTTILAQRNISKDAQQASNQNTFDKRGLYEQYNNLSGEFSHGFNFPKSSKDSIWVQDSTLFYEKENNLLKLKWREKTLARNEHGNVTNGISHFWDEANQSWTNRDTSIVTYYDADTENGHLRKSWNSETINWTDTTLFIKYDQAKNRILLQSKSWSIIENLFIGGIQYSSSYDSNGNKKQEVGKDWNIEAEEWVNSHKASLTYDENNNRIDEQWQYWNYETEVWDYSVKYVFTYDDTGYQLLRLQYYWNNQLNDWEINSQRVSAYNTNGNVINELYQNWDNEIEEWNNSFQMSYSYDENGNQIEYLAQNWESEIGGWRNNYQYFYSYNENGNRTNYHYQLWDLETEVWINSLQRFYNYDYNGNLVEILNQSWNDEWIDDWLYNYYYSQFDFNNINEANSNLISIYPNPTFDKIRISGNISLRNANYTIYSVSGNKVINNKLNNQNEIDITNLPKGTYFIDIEIENKSIVKKVVKR